MRNAGTIIIWAFVAVVAAVAVALWLGFGGGENDERPGDRDIPVDAASVIRETFVDQIEALGTANANESVILTAKVSETVKSINFTDGQTVEAGDIVIELTNGEERAQVAEARASLTEAQQQFDRVQDLVNSGNVSVATLDERTRELEEARSRLAAAEARLEDRIVRAPFSGALGLRLVSQGALVSPGEQITTLDDVSLIKLDFSIPATFVTALAEGQQIVAHSSAYPGKEFRGDVTVIDSRVDTVTRAIKVRAEIPNPDGFIKPGTLMTVIVSTNERDSLTVPEAALVPVADRQFVFRIGSDNSVERVEVVIGGRRIGVAEVLSGINQGDRVVTSGTLRMRDGAKVRVKGAPTARDDAGVGPRG